MTLDLDGYVSRLRDAKLAPGTIACYRALVRRGLEARDLLAPLRRARTRSARQSAAAALLHWAEAAGDKALAARIRAVRLPPRTPPRTVRLTAEVRGRIDAALADLPPARRHLLRLIVWSGLRAGEAIALDRSEVYGLCNGAGLRPEVRAAAKGLLALRRPAWRTAGDAVSEGGPGAAYAVLRRTMRAVCRRIGAETTALEEFRRLRRSEGCAT